MHTVDSRTPSPFAGALLFSYVANYIYDGDAPLAERRAQALSIDQDQLRELMGDADLRELLDLGAIEETEEQLQCLVENYKARNMDGVHDLLLRLGDLTRGELRLRCVADVAESMGRLIKARRVLELMVGGEKRVMAVEDAANALGPGRQGIHRIMSLVASPRTMASDIDEIRSAFPWRRRVMVIGDAKRYVVGREQAHDFRRIPTGVAELEAVASPGRQHSKKSG